MPIIEFETTLTETNTIIIPESASNHLQKNEHFKIYMVPDNEVERLEETLF